MVKITSYYLKHHLDYSYFLIQDGGVLANKQYNFILMVIIKIAKIDLFLYVIPHPIILRQNNMPDAFLNIFLV